MAAAPTAIHALLLSPLQLAPPTSFPEPEGLAAECTWLSRYTSYIVRKYKKQDPLQLPFLFRSQAPLFLHSDFLIQTLLQSIIKPSIPVCLCCWAQRTRTCVASMCNLQSRWHWVWAQQKSHSPLLLHPTQTQPYSTPPYHTGNSESFLDARPM